MNGVILIPSLCLYPMHESNVEIISILEGNQIEPDNGTFSECYIEFFKSHHNEI